MGEYKPYKMKYQGKGGNPVQGNFPGSFKSAGISTDNTKPTMAQDPGSPVPFFGAVAGLVGKAVGIGKKVAGVVGKVKKGIDTVKNVGGKIKDFVSQKLDSGITYNTAAQSSPTKHDGPKVFGKYLPHEHPNQEKIKRKSKMKTSEK